MTENRAYKRKRMLIAGWLADYYGKPDDLISPYSEAAVDLIKYLTAHGWVIREEGPGDHTYYPNHNSRSSHVRQTTGR